jgi:hypothetical protein
MQKKRIFTSFITPSLLRTEGAGIQATYLVDKVEEICCAELKKLNELSSSLSRPT